MFEAIDKKTTTKVHPKDKNIQLITRLVGFDRAFLFLGVLSIAAVNNAFKICDLWLGLEIIVNHEPAN